MPEPYNVLFLCTGNSARSILAESLLTAHADGRFRAYSAGSFPRGTVRSEALRLLRALDLPAAALRSKSWDEFAGPDAPHMDFVLTVCDDAAGEVCPVWPGRPVTAHWGIPDPAAVDGSEAEIAHAFAEALRMLERRIKIFLALPMEQLDTIALKRELDAIGGSVPA